MIMLCTADLDMAKTVSLNDITVFFTNAAWVVCFTYHIVLKVSPGAANFVQDMLFDVPFLVTRLKQEN